MLCPSFCFPLSYSEKKVRKLIFYPFSPEEILSYNPYKHLASEHPLELCVRVVRASAPGNSTGSRSSFILHYHVTSLKFNSGGGLSRKQYLVTASLPCKMGQAVDSVLQICQLTELKQTKEWEGYPNRFRHLCETLLPENMRKDCQEWQQAKRSQRSSFSFRKTANRKAS